VDLVIPPGPRPDKESLSNKIASATHRFATNMGMIDQHQGSMFLNFAKLYIKRNVPQVNLENVKTFDEWVAKYSGGRAAFFRDLRDQTTHTAREYDIASFVKDESYDEIKPARSINHLADIFAAYLGTAIGAADKALFNVRIRQGSGFVKGTNPSTWGALQEALFGDQPVCGTDFTSFEAHHRGVFAQAVAFWLNHALRPLNLPSSLRTFIHEAVLGRNCVRMRGIRIMVMQRLMSGNLWTSSANGLLNLLINSYLFVYRPGRTIEKMVDHAYYFKILVEGDDAIFQYHVNNRHLIAALGLRYKIEEHRHHGTASFCSTYRSITTLKSYCEPTKFLRKFWTVGIKYDSSKNDLHMMRAKALSYGTMYPHVPIVADACRDVLDRTRGFDCRKHLRILRDSEYKFRNLDQTLPFNHIGGDNVGPDDRRDFADIFGYPISTQQRFKSHLRKNRCDIETYGLATAESLWHAERYLSGSKWRVRSYEDVNVHMSEMLARPIPMWNDYRPVFHYRTSAFNYDEYGSIR